MTVTTTVDEHLGQRLRRRRRALGMTQKQLGTAAGVRFQQIQKYEWGVNKMSAERIWRLAQALDVPVGYFYEGLGREPSPARGHAHHPSV
jgi:transcriptional regulator with XRE-family HTH domain